jgi:hypothetical protein
MTTKLRVLALVVTLAVVSVGCDLLRAPANPPAGEAVPLQPDQPATAQQPQQSQQPQIEAVALPAETGAGVPSGTIVAYFGAEIPVGWVLCDGRPTASGRPTPDLRNRFVMGVDPTAEPVGRVGGASSHDHSGVTGKPKEEDQGVDKDSNAHAANDGHTHDVKVARADHLPPYVKLIYIMKE